MSEAGREYGAVPRRADVRPRLRPTRLLLSLLVTAASVFLAAGILPGFDVGSFGVALVAALVIGLLTAFFSPLVAAIQLPAMAGPAPIRSTPSAAMSRLFRPGSSTAGSRRMSRGPRDERPIYRAIAKPSAKPTASRAPGDEWRCSHTTVSPSTV